MLSALIVGLGMWMFIQKKGGLRSFEPPRGKAILSWSKVEDSSVSSYKIYYGKNRRNGDCPDGGYEKSKEVGNIGEYTLSDLEPGETYYFSVSAKNSAGKESCFSDEMNKKIPSKSKLFWETVWQKIRR